VIHKIRLLHRELYRFGHTLPKRDKLGIHAVIESQCLSLLSIVITAAFEQQDNKLSTLKNARIHFQVLINLLRTEHELNVIKEKTYIHLFKQIAEIGKMINGWITYQTQKKP